MQRGTSRDKAEVSFVYLATHISLLHSEKTLMVSRTVVYNAPEYKRADLFIVGRQGLHKFTCVKTAWGTRHIVNYIELYCEILRDISVDEDSSVNHFYRYTYIVMIRFYSQFFFFFFRFVQKKVCFYHTYTHARTRARIRAC